MVKLGFIGFGEAAFNIAGGLKEEGLEGITAFDKFWNIAPQSELIQKRAQEIGVTLMPSEQALVEGADIVVSAVSADLAIHLAEVVKPFLRPEQIFVDFNATSPMTKEKIAALLPPETKLVDCAVMGPVPNYRHKVPMNVSGRGAKEFVEKMAPYGMNITYMDGPAGAASASKMFRSIFMKGFVALLLETIVAAHKYGVEDDVLASLGGTLTSGPILEVINGLLGRGVIHSERREHEMEEVIATLKGLDVDSIMSQATKDKLHWCTGLGLKAYFQGVPPEDFHQIFAAMDAQED